MVSNVTLLLKVSLEHALNQPELSLLPTDLSCLLDQPVRVNRLTELAAVAEVDADAASSPMVRRAVSIAFVDESAATRNSLLHRLNHISHALFAIFLLVAFELDDRVGPRWDGWVELEGREPDREVEWEVLLLRKLNRFRDTFIAYQAERANSETRTEMN